MLRNLASGNKDFTAEPVSVISRVNWEFMVSLKQPLGPLLADTPPPTMRTHCLWIFPPTTSHGWRSSGTVQRAMFQFGYVPEPLATFTIQKSWYAFPLSPSESREANGLAEFLLPHFEKPDATSIIHFHAALYRLSQMAIVNIPPGELPRPENMANQKVEAAVSWFTEHMHENPNLEEIARALRISSSHLRRIFWSVRKVNPHSVFMEMRIRRAMETMTDNSASLEAVAEASGFGSASDFSRSFKRNKGITPSQWRKGLLTK